MKATKVFPTGVRKVKKVHTAAINEELQVSSNTSPGDIRICSTQNQLIPFKNDDEQDLLVLPAPQPVQRRLLTELQMVGS